MWIICSSRSYKTVSYCYSCIFFWRYVLEMMKRRSELSLLSADLLIFPKFLSRCFIWLGYTNMDRHSFWLEYIKCNTSTQYFCYLSHIFHTSTSWFYVLFFPLDLSTECFNLLIIFSWKLAYHLLSLCGFQFHNLTKYHLS